MVCDIADESIDGVLLLDVIEHLSQPDNCLGEIERVLVGGGVFIIAVLFLYSIYDAPLALLIVFLPFNVLLINILSFLLSVFP